MTTLAQLFGGPPISVLDGRQGYWRTRFKYWANLGLDSRLGRAEGLLGAGVSGGLPENGTSQFDPVLTELMYRWFCPNGGVILDPFAGGPVRGIVASALNYEYIGVDIRPEQVEANNQHSEMLKVKPHWITGDSCQLDRLILPQADFIFSCPPYYDLEIYSDNPADLSNKPTFSKFLLSYKTVIEQSLALLKADRFAAFVVGDIRGADGFYRDLIGHTVRIFGEGGAKLYNQVIFIPKSNAHVRAARGFVTTRKLTKVHQNVLIFCKGSPIRAVANLGGKP